MLSKLQRTSLAMSIIVPFLLIRSLRQQGLYGWGWTAVAIFSYLVSCVLLVLMGKVFEKHYGEEGTAEDETEDGNEAEGQPPISDDL